NLSGSSDTRLYRNYTATPDTVPMVPAGLAADVSSHSATLRWDATNDAQTPSSGLSYNLRIGTTPGGSDILAPAALTPDGDRRLAQIGNAGQHTSWTLNGLVPGKTYYWSVQAIDSALAGSPFGSEHSFTTASLIGFTTTSATVDEDE